MTTTDARPGLIEALQATARERPLVALSLGAGVQSTTLALMAHEGALQRPDLAIFADTGWEPAAVYAHLARLEEHLSFPVLRVQEGNLRHDIVDPDARFAAIPYFTKRPEGPCDPCGATGKVMRPDPVTDVLTLQRCNRCKGSGHDDGRGIGRRQCTSEYKLTPIRRLIRQLLGAKAPEHRVVPRGRACEQWVGFSTDEVERANRRKDSDGVQYLTTRYPLLELGLSRTDCDRWLLERGWSTEKSACIGCPFHGNAQWRHLRDNVPDEWADAVAFDAAIRKGGARGEGLDGEAFLHRSLLPLADAPLERVSRREWKNAQVSIFDAVEDQLLEDRMTAREAAEAEEGRPMACSPFGCDDGEEED